MLIDAQTIGSNPKKFDVVIPRLEIDLERKYGELVDDVIVTGETRSADGVLTVNGSLSTRLTLACDRCLEPVDRPMDIVFEARYVRPEAFGADSETVLEGDDLTVDILKDDALELGAIAREQIILNLPDQLFCSQDCHGLCDRCGGNRNLIDCNCNSEEIDPRWARLKNLN